MLRNDTRFAYKLARKGIRADGRIQEIAGYCARNAPNWEMARLLQSGMQISTESYTAMRTFIEHDWLEAGQILLDRGMDFDAFKQWADEKHIDMSGHDAFEQLDAHWGRMHGQEEQQGRMQMG